MVGFMSVSMPASAFQDHLGRAVHVPSAVTINNLDTSPGSFISAEAGHAVKGTIKTSRNRIKNREFTSDPWGARQQQRELKTCPPLSIHTGLRVGPERQHINTR